MIFDMREHFDAIRREKVLNDKLLELQQACDFLLTLKTTPPTPTPTPTPPPQQQEKKIV